MQQTVNQNDDENDINLTPMLDVVFIMLIFFIVTASFVRETGIEVNQPRSTNPAQPDNVSLLIAISDTNELWLEGRLIDPRALRANFERLHSEQPESSLVIQADQLSSNNALVTVMDAARQAGIYAIALAARDN